MCLLQFLVLDSNEETKSMIEYSDSSLVVSDTVSTGKKTFPQGNIPYIFRIEQ
jgi:hypothetical protein